MLILRAKYEELFPLESNVRFVADQVITILKYLFITVFVLLTQLCMIVLAKYIIGFRYLDAFLLVLISEILISTAVFFIWLTYQCDYLEWKHEQAKLHDKISKGEYDHESAEYVKPKLSSFMTTFNQYFPIGSLRRYFARRIYIVMIVTLSLVIHYIITMFVAHWIFGPVIYTRDNEPASEIVIYIHGVAVQCVILLVCLGIIVCCGSYCESAWSHHKLRAESALAHSN
jgi:hypothetical protein